MTLGSTVGGFIPSMWGDGFLSLSGFLLSAVGALAGIWLGVKFRDLI